MLFCIAVFYSSNFAQEEPVPCLEIYIKVINGPFGIYTFGAHTDQETRWDQQGKLTFDFIDAYYVIDPENPNSYCPSLGFDLSGDCYGTAPNGQLGKNVYTIRVQNIQGKSASILIDANGCENLQGGDLYLIYDYSQDKFFKGLSCSISTNFQITNYAFYSGKSCLELYLSVTAQNGSPYLQWNSSRQTGYTGYNIYRCINETPTIFTLISTTSNTYFLDEDLSAGNTWKVWYKVIAKNNSNELGLFSNAVGTTFNAFRKSKEDNQKSNNNLLEFYIEQNYPNPFNPVSKVKYQIANKGMISLKVFDVLGKEVATLVNKEQEGSQ